jgi:recombination protein RecA
MRTRGKSSSDTKESDELGEVITQIGKRYGTKTIIKGSDRYQPDRISTGSFMLDFCTLGGIPVSAGTTLIGDKHAGKTMIASKIIGNAQRMFPDQRVVLIDVEGTYDPVWAEHLGVDPNALYLASPDTGEMAVDIADAVIGSKETSLVVIDSVAMLLPTKEAESSADDAHIGLQSRLINSLVRKCTGSIVRERKRDHWVSVVMLNQWRTKIGGFSPTGDPRTMPGGRAVEHFSGLMVTLKNKENKGKDGLGIETMSHNEHPFTINKNKYNTGPRSGEFTLIRSQDNEYGLSPGDIENYTTMLAYAKKFGIYSGGGSSWTLEFEDYSVKVSKMSEMVTALMEDPEFFRDLWVHLIQLQAANVGQKEEFIERIPLFYA